MNTKDTKNYQLPPRCQFTVLKNITVKNMYLLMTYRNFRTSSKLR